MWHDLIKNTIPRQKSNNYHCAGVDNVSKNKKDRFSAIAYCRRIGTEDIFQELLKFEVLSVTKNNFEEKKKEAARKVLPAA